MKLKKSIFVLASDYDQSTSDVLNWLLLKKSCIVRFDYTKEFKVNEVIINKKRIEVKFNYGNNNYSTKSILSFWFRRGTIISESIKLPHTIHAGIKWYMNEEKKSVNDFFIYELDKKAPINKISRGDINKLLQLSIALSCGLEIPNTLLSTNSTSVRNFMSSNIKIISKSIQVPFGIVNKNKSYTLYTSTINDRDLSQNTFFITKFQKQIEKQYEIRIFFLKNELYPMAIFSQENSKTKIDFRNYDISFPNRCVPYKLPFGIENKIKKFIKKICLTSGSIDMIVDVKNKFYFLEVNPVGQFNMVSKPCNYYIEEKIANTLHEY
jgi:ATP-GRASP peptide maturase of grasp-with-spasm system